jgi:acyl-CoA dehydrogenase
MYSSPVEDILFSLRHVAGLNAAIAEGAFGDLDWRPITAVEATRFAPEVALRARRSRHYG